MTRVLLLTGPPGAGKSTLAKSFTAQAPGTWAYVDQDEVRKQVKAGFTNPSDPWTEETQKQWDVSIGICADMARRYQEHNINCLIDCFVPPHAREKWEKAFRGIDYEIFVLLPKVEVAVNRNAQRSGAAKLRETQIRQHHEWFEVYRNNSRLMIIDSSEQTADELVHTLAEAING